MKLFTTKIYKIFTFEDFSHSYGKKVSRKSLHTLLAYHEKKGHIIRIRRGLFCTVPEGIRPEDCPIDSFLLTSKLSKDAVLAYRTALDFYGKLYSATNEFLYLSKKHETKPFIYKGITYRSITIPASLVESNQTDYGIETLRRGDQVLRVTNLERTVVDVLDRPRLCGSWEEIWRSLESIEYLDLEAIFKYLLLLQNTSAILRVGYFLESHRDAWMVPDKFLEELRKHVPKKPIYWDRNLKEPSKLMANWNLIVPLSIIRKQWEEPDADI